MVGKIIAVVGSVNLDLVCTTERIPVVPLQGELSRPLTVARVRIKRWPSPDRAIGCA
jgi:hypothetical protein